MTQKQKPHGVYEWRLDRWATLLVIPATPILLFLMYMWSRNFTLNPSSYLENEQIVSGIVTYLLLTSFFNAMSLKAIVDDYVSSPRLKSVCWFGLIFFVIVMPVLTIALLLKQVVM